MSKDYKDHRPWHKLLISLVAVFLLLATLPAPAQEAKRVEVAASDQERETEAFNLASEAYIYGYPLVIMQKVHQVMINVAAPEGFHAPLGQFAHQKQFPDESFRGMPNPNMDTLFSFAWLDLSKEPFILSLPDEKGRYYLMELLDAWTNVFAAPGKRTSRTKAQKYAITGPGWQGRLPRGVKEFKSPTNMVWIIGHTYCTGTPQDYKAVHAIQAHYKLVPLSAYGKPYTPPKGTVDQNVDMKTSGWEQVKRMDAASYFKTLAQAMQANPPAAADGPMVAKLAKIGLTPEHDFDLNKLDPAVTRGLERAPKAAQEKIMAHGKNAGVQVNGWQYTLKTGSYGTDYLQRAYITTVALGANLPQDKVDMMTKDDGDDKSLDGGNRYVLHFPNGKTAPVQGFWSLTMYNSEHFLMANPLNRYKLNSRSKFRQNRDGSLDLYIQKDSPGKNKESNWLPAPAGKFELMLRLYWVKESVLKGTWKPPAVTRLN
jgi:DNA sulfur modification protein DndE